jgi:hypothetical protein
MGHVHCNKVIVPDIGFMVAGFGQSGCGNFGFTVFDTYNDRFKVYYFGFAEDGILNQTNYDSTVDCITKYGISKCYSYASVWVDVPL